MKCVFAFQQFENVSTVEVAVLEPGPLVLDRVLGYCAMLLATERAERVQG